MSGAEPALDLSLLARSSPAALAWVANLNRETGVSTWKLPPHLALLNRRIQELVALELQRDGYRGIIVEMPPRHGKSELCSHYTPAWFLGLFPNKRVALASYEADFAATWGRKARQVLEDFGPPIFGVEVDARSSAANRWEVRPLKGKRGDPGGMVTTGIGGPLTGRGANLLVVDDPVKNALEAHSKSRRQAIWDWWTSTAMTRLEPDAVVLIVMTRWHEDDLAGRLLKQMQSGEGERWLRITLPALAREDDPLGRAPGEALWVDRYNETMLETTRRAVGAYVWSALYQQSPSSQTGGMFERDQIQVVGEIPGKVKRMVRFWDLAGTEAGGDYTAGLLMARLADNRYVIADVKRGQFASQELENLIMTTAQADGPNVRIRMEQERGSAGKLLVDHYKRLLTGYDFKGVWTTGDKVLRARPLSACSQRGELLIVRADWNMDLLEEYVLFDHGAYDDQVDAGSGAFETLRKSGGVVAI